MIKHGVQKMENESSAGDDVAEIVAKKEEPESIEKHEKMVVLNPNDYNSWNFLKSHCRDKFGRQMELTQKAIENDPKSYATWYHRYYFFKENRESWFNEHRLCNILLMLDSRNFHCWNYCLRNGFENKLDLHNFSSMHFKDFRDEYLFIDPSDEGVWRSFQKKYANCSMGRLVIDNKRRCIEIEFNKPFVGTMNINQKRHNVDSVRKRVVINEEHIEDIFINGIKMRIEEEFGDGTVEDVLKLDGNCIHALKYKLMYSKDKASVLNHLIKIDPLRRHYYRNLAEDEREYYILRQAAL